MAFLLSNPTGVVLIDSRSSSGTVTLPLSTEYAGRVVIFKDTYGSFSSNALFLSTSGGDTFEDGTTLKTVVNPFNSISLISYFGIWYQISPTDYALTSSIQGLGTMSYVSTLTTISSSYITTSTINTNTIVLGESSKYDWVATGGEYANFDIIYSKDGIHWVTASNLNGFNTVQKVSLINDIYYAVGDDPTGNSIKYSHDGFTWSNTCNGGFGNGRGAGWDIIYNGSIYVVPGNASYEENNSTIAYSYDGMNWSNADVGFQNVSDIGGAGISVAYGKEKFVAVGHQINASNQYVASIKYSSNAQTWCNVSSNGDGQFTLQGLSVKFANDLFVAGGYQIGLSPVGILKYSYDGVTWYNGSTSIGVNGYIRAVEYLNNSWYATWTNGSYSQILNSANGISWTTLSSSNLPAQIDSMSYNPNTGMWLITGEGFGNAYRLAYSYDLCNFTAVNYTNVFNYGFFVNFIGQRLLIFSASSNGDFLINNTVPWSSDLVSTTAGINTLLANEYIQTPGLTSTVEGLGTASYISSLNLELASTVKGLGTASYISSLNLELASTVAGLGTATYISSIAPQLASTVAGLGTASYVSSTIDLNTSSITFTFDGVEINIQTPFVRANRVIYNGTGLWVACGKTSANSNQIATSTDGYVWTPRYANSVSEVNDIAYNGSNLYILVGNATISSYDAVQTSSNGINWIPYSGGGGGGAGYTLTFGIAYLSNTWISLGNNGSGFALKTSADGATWTNRVTPFLYAKGVAYNGSNLFVACGFTDGTNSNTICTSSDLSTWTPQSNTLVDAVRVRFGGGLFVACGSPDTGLSGLIASTDGSNWVQSSPLLAPNDIFYNSNNGFWYAIGGAGIWESTDGSNWSSNIPTSFTDGRSLTYANGRYVVVGSNTGTTLGSIQMGYNVSSLFYSNDKTYFRGSNGKLYVNDVLYGTQQIDLTSTLQGLGTASYISSLNPELTSTVAGLGTASYISSLNPELTSTVAGLGTASYVSTASLESSITTVYSDWSTYSVSWTATTSNPSIGDGTLTGRYKQIGKTVFVNIQLNIGTTTDLGAGGWKLSLPVNANNANSVILPATILDNGTAWYQGLGFTHYYGETSNVAVVWDRGATGGQAVDAATPFSWVNGDNLILSGTYESA